MEGRARATRGGQPRYSALAITTALTLRAVFRLALRQGSEPVHLLVDSTGLKLCGPGEWFVEKHATRTATPERMINH